jgi:hypothetical protein
MSLEGVDPTQLHNTPDMVFLINDIQLEKSGCVSMFIKVTVVEQSNKLYEETMKDLELAQFPNILHLTHVAMGFQTHKEWVEVGWKISSLTLKCSSIWQVGERGNAGISNQQEY